MIDTTGLILNHSRQDYVIDTSAEHRDLCLAMARQTQRTLYIYTRDLDSAVYDQRPFIEAVKQIALNNRKAMIRILVKDTRKALNQGHGLIRLSQQLSSYVQIRVPNDDYKNYNEAFLIADESGVIHRLLADRYEANANFCAPSQAAELIKFFNKVWLSSEPDQKTKRLC